MNISLKTHGFVQISQHIIALLLAFFILKCSSHHVKPKKLIIIIFLLNFLRLCSLISKKPLFQSEIPPMVWFSLFSIVFHLNLNLVFEFLFAELKQLLIDWYIHFLLAILKQIKILHDWSSYFLDDFILLLLIAAEIFNLFFEVWFPDLELAFQRFFEQVDLCSIWKEGANAEICDGNSVVLPKVIVSDSGLKNKLLLRLDEVVLTLLWHVLLYFLSVLIIKRVNEIYVLLKA